VAADIVIPKGARDFISAPCVFQDISAAAPSRKCPSAIQPALSGRVSRRLIEQNLNTF
jgi:hypothetical protein